MINTKRITCDGARTFFPYVQVYEAITKVNELFTNEEFYNRIACSADFDMADISPDSIAELMRKARLNMSVELYYAVNPLRNIDGYDDIRTPSIIHMNLWKIDRPVTSLCNSMVHATVHAVNAYYDRCYFGHGNLPGVSKENTAPCVIGAIAECMISGEDKAFLVMEHDNFDISRKGLKDQPMLSFGAIA